MLSSSSPLEKYLRTFNYAATELPLCKSTLSVLQYCSLCFHFPALGSWPLAKETKKNFILIHHKGKGVALSPVLEVKAKG